MVKGGTSLGSTRFAGLGIPVIQDSFDHISSFADPALKAIFTSVTLGGGFKGGEFVPLVFIGATLGSALSAIVPVSTTLLAACGFASVFAGAANTPIACSIMAIEIFGWQVTPYVVVACYVSYLCSGANGIYRSQKKE